MDAKFASVCPLHWRVPLRLTYEFVERTKGHLVVVLTALESKDAMDVHALLKALQTTLRFEQEMATRFGITATTLANTTTNNTSATTTTTGGSTVSSPMYAGSTITTNNNNNNNNRLESTESNTSY